MNETNKCNDTASVGCCRQSGRGALKDYIERLNQRAYHFSVLSAALPQNLTPEQDNALHNIALSLLCNHKV